jgi:hypothetical protein
MLDLAQTVRVPPRAERITFTYAGLSLSAPERVQCRYMLDGWDHAWSAPTAVTEAGYSNLRPAVYRFRVIASKRLAQTIQTFRPERRGSVSRNLERET